MQLPTQDDKDKRGLNFYGPCNEKATTHLTKTEDEGDYEESPSLHEDLVLEAPSLPMSQCSIPSYLFEHVNMIGDSSISSFSHPLDFDSIHVMDQDVVDFTLIPNLDLSMHDGFSFSCS